MTEIMDNEGSLHWEDLAPGWSCFFEMITQASGGSQDLSTVCR